MNSDPRHNVYAFPAPGEKACAEHVRNGLEIDVLPVLNAIETMAEAMRALEAIDHAAGTSPTFADTLRDACPDYRNALMAHDPWQVVAELARIARLRASESIAVANGVIETEHATAARAAARARARASDQSGAVPGP